MLDAIITSQTRIKLLISLFLNTNTEKYLRQFAEELNESPSITKTELDRFEKAGLIVSEQKGNKKFYKVNKTYPLYNEITSIVQKTLGLDKIYEMVESLGNIEQAFIVGDYANGIDSGIIDLVIYGTVDQELLYKLSKSLSGKIGRLIRYAVVDNKKDLKFFKDQPKIPVWEN